MDFWVVAIDHELQLLQDPNDPKHRAAQKEQLETLLRTGIPERGVRLIAEESKLGRVTIASALADANNPPIPWKNIIMTDAERAAAGILEALRHRPGHPDYDTMQFWIECRIPEDEIRESFFVDETLRAAAADAESILMLLGDMHVDAVGERLLTAGHNVVTNHDLFPVRRWE